jgi:Fe2+ or Zn2+ uptake regulation protein
MQDMKDLEDELLKIGSYYIQKHEYLVNTECNKAFPLVDRISLLEDLLQKELDFQFEKVQLIHAYMETYEHITDPLE